MSGKSSSRLSVLSLPSLLIELSDSGQQSLSGERDRCRGIGNRCARSQGPIVGGTSYEMYIWLDCAAISAH